MRRDTFLRSMAALAAAGALPLVGPRGAEPEDDDPGQPGRRLGHTGRALGKALQEAGARPHRSRQQGRCGRRHRPGAVRQRQQGRPQRADGWAR